MNQLFISYSRKDTDFARKLTENLTAQNMETWVDWDDIPPSVDWMKEIEKGIEEADVFIFIVSPDSIRSSVCAEEVAHAIKNGKRIIPVVAREVDLKEAPATLTHLNWTFFSRPQDKFEEAFEKLILAIQTDFDWVSTHARLQVKALEWERNNNEISFLLRGKDLEDAEAQLKVNGEKNPHPTDLQRKYIAISLETEQKQIEQQRAREQQLEMEKKLGVRLKRITYLLLGIFTIAYLVLFFWLNTVTNNLAQKAIQDQMLALVETSVCFFNVNGDGYQSLIEYFPAGDDSVYKDDFYVFMTSLLADIKATNTNIQTKIALYTITQGKSPDEFLEISSTDIANDYKILNTGYAPETAQIAGMKTTTVDMNVYTDDLGSWVSACAPILNSQGRSLGALCTDFSAQLLEDTRKKVTTTLGIAFIAIYPAMIALVFFATRSFQKKRNSITK